MRKDDELQVTNAGSHFTLPIASNVGDRDVFDGRQLLRDRHEHDPDQEKQERPPRFWRFRAASARPVPGAVPDEPPKPAEKGRGDIRRSAIARGLARFAPDGSSATIAHNSRVATSLGSRDSLAASSHGSTFRRANADMTLSTVPFSSSPIGVKRNSSNLCSKRNSECIFGISITASRRLSGRETTLRLRLQLSRLLT